jgi:hypothetical protein
MKKRIESNTYRGTINVSLYSNNRRLFKMVTEKSWQEFRDSGLFWFMNSILHAFGWAIVYEPESGVAYPARVKFRGFSEEINTDGYIKVSKFMKAHVEELLKEAQE